MSSHDLPPVNLAAVTLLTGLAAWGAILNGPLVLGGQVQGLPALLGGIAAVGAVQLLIGGLLLLARLTDRISAQTATTGRAGTARWARRKDLKRELSRTRTGPFWGCMAGWRGLPLFADYASNAVTIAPSGSGKGIYTMITNALSIRFSKVIGDFKGENACILKDALEARGEQVRILNPGRLWVERLGEGDRLNPLDPIVDDLHRPGGLRDLPDDLRELAMQLLPDAAEPKGNERYFNEGSRRAIGMATVIECMVEEYDATLSSVALLLEDRTAFQHHLRWIIGIDLEGAALPEGPMPIEQAAWAHRHDPEDVAAFARLVRAWAANWLAMMTTSDNRTFESFISGAQQALAPFAFGRLAPAMGRSTFSPNDLKDGAHPTTLFIVADASRPETSSAYLGLMQWTVLTAMKRHPDKKCPVYFLMDEATNAKIQGLDSLLTWGRSYGIRLHLIFQDLSAFEHAYGKTALETLLSETEIKQFLPGQRSPRTLELISKLLGEQSVMAASLAREEHGLREQYSESGRPLMTPDEIRRSEHGLLLVRRARPVLIEPVSYGAVHPWRKQAGINPFHGTPFLQPVRLRL